MNVSLLATSSHAERERVIGAACFSAVHCTRRDPEPLLVEIILFAVDQREEVRSVGSYLPRSSAMRPGISFACSRCFSMYRMALGSALVATICEPPQHYGVHTLRTPTSWCSYSSRTRPPSRRCAIGTFLLTLTQRNRDWIHVHVTVVMCVRLCVRHPSCECPY